MCGRTVCTLDPAAICRRCAYKDRSGKVVQPSWREAPTGDAYHPSYNIPPTAFTPVLVSARALAEACPALSQRPATDGGSSSSGCAGSIAAAAERIVQPMRWGMVPPWHSGPDAKSFSLLLSNCRSDSMTTKRSFIAPLRKGRRCVVLAEGFYEWKQTTKPKQPHFIRYLRDSCGSVDREDCQLDDLSIKKENVPVGPGHLDGELMKMAGIFDVWMDQSTGEPLCSYCMITVDGSSVIGDIHDRMPAILRDDDEVTRWLDSEKYPLDEVTRLVRPSERIDSYPVSTFVSNVRNNSAECIAPLVERKPSPTGSPAAGLMKWFVKTDDRDRKIAPAEAASARVKCGSPLPRPVPAAAAAACGIKRHGDSVENEVTTRQKKRGTPGHD